MDHRSLTVAVLTRDLEPRTDHRSLTLAVLTLAWLAAAAVVLAGCRGHASAEQCAAMKERYLDLAVKEAPGAAALSAGQRAAVREVERGLKRAEPSYRFVDDHCEAVTRAEVSCAMDADTTRGWEACVHPGDAR